MKGDFYINEKIAPKEWSKFEPWHAKAASSDPLSAKDRFVKLGGTLPTQKKDKKNVDNKRIDKEIK